MMPRDAVVDKLYSLYNQKGYVTQDDIFDLCDEYDLSIIDVDYVSNKIISLGVMISEEKIWNPTALKGKTDDILLDDVSEHDTEILVYFQMNYPQLSSVIEFIKKTPRFKKGQSYQLWVQTKSGNIYARNNIAEKYMIIPFRAAYLYKEKTDYPLDDLVSQAFVSLLEAIDSYDYKKGKSFSGYSLYYIYYDLNRFLMANERLIRIPIHCQDNIKPIIKLWNERLDDSLGHFAKEIYDNYHDLYQYIGVFFIYWSISDMESIEEILENDAEKVLPEDQSFDMFEECCHNIMVKELKCALAVLSDREAFVIRKRFGIGFDSTSTLEQVANCLGLTRERIRQIENKSFKKLRHSIKTKVIKWWLH